MSNLIIKTRAVSRPVFAAQLAATTVVAATAVVAPVVVTAAAENKNKDNNPPATAKSASVHKTFSFIYII